MDAEQARQAAHAAVLNGLRAGRNLAEIERDVLGCRVRRVYEPDLAMLELIITALDDAGVSRRHPLDIGDWRQRFLPEIDFRNKHTDVQRRSTPSRQPRLSAQDSARTSSTTPTAGAPQCCCPMPHAPPS